MTPMPFAISVKKAPRVYCEAPSFTGSQQQLHLALPIDRLRRP
jgi:hypothetical protein